MNIPKDARLNMTRAAEVVSMDVSHLRRLVRRGVFPKPKRTGKGMPFFDYDLLVQISTILRTGVGLNKEEIAFYNRKPKAVKKGKPQAKQRKHHSPNPFIASVIEGCKELGIAKDKLTVEAVKQIVAAEFNGEQPELKHVIPVVARRILAEELRYRIEQYSACSSVPTPIGDVAKWDLRKLILRVFCQLEDDYGIDATQLH